MVKWCLCDIICFDNTCVLGDNKGKLRALFKQNSEAKAEAVMLSVLSTGYEKKHSNTDHWLL